MTTIAVDKDGYIAWDSQSTLGNIKSTAGVSKVLMVGRTFYASSGDSEALLPLIKWHRSGANWKTKPSGSWEFLVLAPGKLAKLYDNEGNYPVTQNFPVSLGSGWLIARTAMSLGFSAQVAVETACKMDAYTGGEVHVVNVREMQKLPKKKKDAGHLKAKKNVKLKNKKALL